MSASVQSGGFTTPRWPRRRSLGFLVNLVIPLVTLTLWSPGARNLLVLDRME